MAISFVTMALVSSHGISWCSRRNHDSAVGTWKKTWCHQGGRGASVCCCNLHNVHTPFVPSFEELNYRKELDKLVSATRELQMFELSPASALIKFPQPLELVYLLLNWSS